MNKYITIISLGLLAFTTCFSKVIETNLENSLVWKVTGPQIEEPSYLVGTLHIMCKKDFKIDQRIHDAMAQTEQLFLEFDYDDPNEILEFQKSMYVKESLKDRLTAAQYTQMSELIDTHTRLKIDIFDKASLMTIQSAVLISALKCPSKKMLDYELMTLAQSKSMPVQGLETVAYQIELMNKAFPMNDKVLTKEELEVFYNIGSAFDELVKTYWSEDIVKMEHEFEEQMSILDNSEEVVRLMLKVRNQNWAKRIPGIASEKATVFAFGAGHLAGEVGVINLLRLAGLTVKPVMN